MERVLRGFSSSKYDIYLGTKTINQSIDILLSM